MKKIVILLMTCMACAFASQASDEIEFTTVLENGITPVKTRTAVARAGTMRPSALLRPSCFERRVKSMT